jgi:hypothetical protein
VDLVEEDRAKAVPGIHQANRKIVAGSSILFKVFSSLEPRKVTASREIKRANDTMAHARMNPPRPQHCCTWEHKSKMLPITMALEIDSSPYTMILNSLSVNMSLGGSHGFFSFLFSELPDARCYAGGQHFALKK